MRELEITGTDSSDDDHVDLAQMFLGLDLDVQETFKVLCQVTVKIKLTLMLTSKILQLLKFILGNVKAIQKIL